VRERLFTERVTVVRPRAPIILPDRDAPGRVPGGVREWIVKPSNGVRPPIDAIVSVTCAALAAFDTGMPLSEYGSPRLAAGAVSDQEAAQQ
jgi:hypothetical protein